jgi:hypothetical protein
MSQSVVLHDKNYKRNRMLGNKNGNRGKFPGERVALGRGGSDKFGEGRDLCAGYAEAIPQEFVE